MLVVDGWKYQFNVKNTHKAQPIHPVHIDYLIAILLRSINVLLRGSTPAALVALVCIGVTQARVDMTTVVANNVRRRVVCTTLPVDGPGLEREIGLSLARQKVVAVSFPPRVRKR